MSVPAAFFGTPTYVAYFSIGGEGGIRRFSTDPSIYAGFKWESPLGEFPVPSSAFRNQFGILPQESIDIAVSDPDGSIEAQADSWIGDGGTLYLITNISRIDGSFEQQTYQRGMVITSYVVEGNSVVLTLESAEITSWETLFPERLYNADDFVDLYPDYQGLPIPEVVGFGRKVRCARIGAEPDIYSICKQGSFGTGTVAAVYRDGAIIATNNGGNLEDFEGNIVATVGTFTPVSGPTVVTLSFTTPQPANSTIEADYDCRSVGGELRNAADELNRLMVVAGMSIESSSLTTARSIAVTNEMLIDYVYSRQRTVQSLSEDILELLRGHLARSTGGTNEFYIIQDVGRTSSGTYREDAHKIELGTRGQASRPSTVIVDYGVNPANTNEPFQRLERSVSGGIGRADLPIYLEISSSFSTADRFLDYTRKRKQYSGFASATIYGVQHNLGDRITITDRRGVTRDWTIRRIDREPYANDLELQEYNDAIHSYTPGTAPSDPSVAFDPDYSNTRPAPPTDHGIQTSDAEVDSTGKVTAWVEVYSIPPARNWTRMKYVARDNTDQTLAVADGEELYGSGSAYRGARIRGLKPGHSYDTFSFALNENNLEGIPSAIVTHTSATDNTVPGTISVFAPVAGKGKIIQLFWQKLPDKDISDYILQREVTNSDAWITLDEGNLAASYTDSWNMAYGVSYTYRIAAVDSSGNQGPWTEFAPITLSANIGDQDGNRGDPFNWDQMVTNQATAKELRTNSGFPRIELNWGLDNEIEVFDNSGNLVAEMGWLVDESDDHALSLGNNSFPDACARFRNNGTNINTQISNLGGQGLFVSATYSGSAVAISNNGTGDALFCNGDINMLGDLEITGDIVSLGGYLNITGGVEVSDFIWTRDNLYVDEGIYVGYFSASNSWLIQRVGNELRFRIPNGTSYWRFTDDGTGSGFVP